ncbi:MAG: nucleotidyltransferase domain-containing protein [Clostridium sp.]|nr:nucleotidyltransferase domain-containing protein [Clostridium sp.]
MIATKKGKEVPVIRDMTEAQTREMFYRCEPMLIGYGGSIAYGTNLPTSDVDIRGIYMNPLDEFIGCRPVSEQYCPSGTDITIYSLKKMMHLLLQCNPNVIEILGLRPEHYLYKTAEGQLLLDNAEIFLSKHAAYTFGNYAKSQLNRLMNKSGRANDQVVSNEVRSISKTLSSIRKREGLQNIRIDEVDGVPVLTINESMPIDKFASVTNEINNVHLDYKSSSRNRKAVEHSKLAKHMMHLLRLYMMGIDILESHKIVTYREAEHDLLMDIRNGKYLKEDKTTPTAEFDELLADYTARFEKAVEETTLPKRPDTDKANELMMRLVCMHYDGLSGGTTR